MIWCWFEPSAFISQTWSVPLRLETNAMKRPSGDHAGVRSSDLAVVNRTGLDPSTFITQMSLLPPREDWNAILVPSGENTGVPS